MNREKLPVVAAIPNYNMAESLRELLPVVLEQGYDHVYVLDDASTDNSREVAQQYGDNVTLVAGEVNGGAGAARNMILDIVTDPTLIHFMDADIRLETQNSAEVARNLFKDRPDIGFIGGLVKTESGRQSYWNYGERQSFSSMVSSWGQAALEATGIKYPKTELFIHKYHLWPGLSSRPNPTQPPIRRAVYWAIEANLMIMSNTLREAGGFDTSIREHDIQPLAVATQEAGLINYFDPSVVVTHLAGNVRHYNRILKAVKTEAYLVKKHGLGKWLLTGAKHNQP